jgi:hypothetical protein
VGLRHSPNVTIHRRTDNRVSFVRSWT